MKSTKIVITERQGQYFVAAGGRKLELGPDVVHREKSLLTLSNSHAAILTVGTVTSMCFVFDLVALKRDYGREFPEPIARFLNNPELKKFWWSTVRDDRMLENSYGNQIKLSGVNGHFPAQPQYSGFPGASEDAASRFDKMFEDVGIYSVRVPFEHLYAASRDMSLVEGVWRLPKAMRASVILYAAVEVMQPLYLAMVKSFSDKEAFTADDPGSG